MSNARIDLVLLINRLALGCYFAIAGYTKIFKQGVGEFYAKSYEKSIPEWLPRFFATPYGYALPFAELIAGAALALGLFGRLAALIITLLLVSFMLALGVHDPGGGPFNKNVIFAALALMLVLTGPGSLSVDACLPGKSRGARVPVQ